MLHTLRAAWRLGMAGTSEQQQQQQQQQDVRVCMCGFFMVHRTRGTRRVEPIWAHKNRLKLWYCVHVDQFSFRLRRA